MKADAALVQSVFDYAIREINALETRIVTAEDDADAMLWEQARQVVEQLEADGGPSQRQLAKQWINVAAVNRIHNGMSRTWPLRGEVYFSRSTPKVSRRVQRRRQH